MQRIPLSLHSLPKSLRNIGIKTLIPTRDPAKKFGIELNMKSLGRNVAIAGGIQRNCKSNP